MERPVKPGCRKIQTLLTKKDHLLPGGLFSGCFHFGNYLFKACFILASAIL